MVSRMDRKRAIVFDSHAGATYNRANPFHRHSSDDSWGNLFVLTHRHLLAARRTLPSLGLLCTVLFVAACSAGGKASTTIANATATSVSTVPTVPVATTPPGVKPIPVSGAYSLYVDPTFGYSFQYPATWIVNPAIGDGESNVVINEPQPLQTDPGFDIHPLTKILVRVTNDYSNSFVQHILCNGSLTNDIIVDGYPTVNMFTGGGDPVKGYTAPAYGVAFFAKDKNLAVQLWLQSNAKSTDQFFVVERANWKQLISTFNPGPGASKLLSGC
jgi:hypothetical protein